MPIFVRKNVAGFLSLADVGGAMRGKMQKTSDVVQTTPKVIETTSDVIRAASGIICPAFGPKNDVWERVLPESVGQKSVFAPYFAQERGKNGAI